MDCVVLFNVQNLVYGQLTMKHVPMEVIQARPLQVNEYIQARPLQVNEYTI